MKNAYGHGRNAVHERLGQRGYETVQRCVIGGEDLRAHYVTVVHGGVTKLQCCRCYGYSRVRAQGRLRDRKDSLALLFRLERT